MREFRPLGNTLFPPVVKNILIINGILFFATYVFQQQFDLREYLSLYYFSSPKFKIWQLVTHLFMHYDLGHIFSNMFALWMFGSILENFMGSKKFLNYYLLSGIGASILYMGVLFLQINPLQKNVEAFEINPNPQNLEVIINQNIDKNNQAYFNQILETWQRYPGNAEVENKAVKSVKQYEAESVNSSVLGASGAVFGLLLAFGMFFPNALIYIYFFFPMKAKYLVILYGLFELYNGVANNPGDNVAHFAHLGGMLIGFILIKIWGIKQPGQFY